MFLWTPHMTSIWTTQTGVGELIFIKEDAMLQYREVGVNMEGIKGQYGNIYNQIHCEIFIAPIKHFKTLKI